MKIRFHTLIFLGMFLGAVVGVLLYSPDDATGFRKVALEFCDLFGRSVFIGALKMLVAPLIFFSILAGITSLPTTGELGRIGLKTFTFYLVTTSIASIIGLVLVLTIQPGLQGNRDEVRANWPKKKEAIQVEFASKTDKVEAARETTAWGAVKKNVERIIQNPFTALSESPPNSLGVIFFAILLGIALIVIGEAGRPVVGVINGMNRAILTLTGWFMLGAPFFIFCLVASLVGTTGPSVFESLLWYVGVVIAGIGIHMGVLLLICKYVGKRSPLAFLRGIRKPWAVAFSTRSSAATLPITMKSVTEELHVDPKVAGFVLPIGATVNMDGTALYEGVAVLFLIQLFGGMEGVPVLTAATTVVVFLTAVLASIGAAAIPDAGLITMVLVANAVGLSVEYIGMIFAVDAFLDMFRTSTNVTGDSVGAVVVERLERGRLGKEESAAA